MAKKFRGRRIFQSMGTDLFGSQDAQGEVAKMGRSPAMLAQRNERLCARLYWYRVFRSELRDEVILARLQEEFDLEPGTIPRVLVTLSVELVDFKKKAPSIEELEERWGWMKWR
jgi:hypothetical protein